AARLSEVEMLSLPAAQAPPSGVKVLIAAPAQSADGFVSESPPSGWPFDLEWIHLPSVGIDATRTGSSAVPLSPAPAAHPLRRWRSLHWPSSSPTPSACPRSGYAPPRLGRRRRWPWCAAARSESSGSV